MTLLWSVVDGRNCRCLRRSSRIAAGVESSSTLGSVHDLPTHFMSLLTSVVSLLGRALRGEPCRRTRIRGCGLMLSAMNLFVSAVVGGGGGGGLLFSRLPWLSVRKRRLQAALLAFMSKPRLGAIGLLRDFGDTTRLPEFGGVDTRLAVSFDVVCRDDGFGSSFVCCRSSVVCAGSGLTGASLSRFLRSGGITMAVPFCVASKTSTTNGRFCVEVFRDFPLGLCALLDKCMLDGVRSLRTSNLLVICVPVRNRSMPK